MHRLFKKMLTPVDDTAWGDGAPERSGSICLSDFERVTLTDLQLVLPRRRLLGLWKALDANGSGLVCMGEWGRFMRFVEDVAPRGRDVLVLVWRKLNKHTVKC